jgi:hypothetical protein
LNEKLEWFKAITELVKATAWPLATVLLVLAIRKELFSLLGRLRKGRYKDIEFDFDAAAKELKSEVKELELKQGPLPLKQVDSAPTTDMDGVIETLKELADTNPPLAILSSWIVLEKDLLGFADRMTVPKLPRGTPISGILDSLESQGKIIPELRKLVEVLRRMRNAVVHSQYTEVTPEIAQLYVSGLVAIRDALQQLSE